MLNKKRIVLILLAIVLIHIIVGVVCAIKWNKGDFHTKVPYYTGIITKKESETYRCGNKSNQYMCENFYIYINDKYLPVSEKSFKEIPIGQKYTHYITRDDTPWIVNYFILIGFISLLIIVPIILYLQISTGE